MYCYAAKKHVHTREEMIDLIAVEVYTSPHVNKCLNNGVWDQDELLLHVAEVIDEFGYAYDDAEKDPFRMYTADGQDLVLARVNHYIKEAG